MAASDGSSRFVGAISQLGLSRRTVVALDVDGVLADQVPHVLSRANKEFGVTMKKAEITAWDTCVASIPFDKLIARYLLDPNFVLTMPEMAGAKEAVAVIREKARIIVGSSRPLETEKETILWLKQHFDFDETQFINTAQTGKLSLPAEILIDDNIDNAAGFARAKIPRFAILFSQPWNQERNGITELIEGKKVIPMENWFSIKNFFQS